MGFLSRLLNRNVPPAFDDSAKEKFVCAVIAMLEVQLVPIDRALIEPAPGFPNPKALGYLYGFIDAALRTIGQDMCDMSVGPPITFHVLRHLFPGREECYYQFLEENLRTNQECFSGLMYGGQQYLEFQQGKIEAPMGLARILLGDR